MISVLRVLTIVIFLGSFLGCHTHPRYEIENSKEPYQFSLRPASLNRTLTPKRIVFRDVNLKPIWEIYSRDPKPISELILTSGTVPSGFEQTYPADGSKPSSMTAYNRVGVIILDAKEEWYCRGFPIRIVGDRIEFDKEIFEEYDLGDESSKYNYFEPEYPSK